MKTLLAIAFLCGLISQGFGLPHYKPKFDDNGFEGYMTDDNYGDADPAWNGFYDKEESLVNQDPNSVWPQQNFQDDRRDEFEGSGWYGVSDDEYDDDYDSSYDRDDAYENEVEEVEDELDYVEDDVQFNEDRIYELEDDLDYDEQKIERMDKRLKKLNKSLTSLQNLVNAMEAARIESNGRQQPYHMPRDADY